jgi:NADH-quinone oxidoreductase subunit E
MPVIDSFPPTDKGHGAVAWSADEQAQVAALFAQYPTKRSAILPIFWLAQRKWGWLSYDVLGLIATTLELPKSEVLAVASFYSMLKKQPTGKYTIQVCHTLSCALRGADAIVAHLEKTLGISAGDTTADGMFTIQRVECLASCGSAPMMQIEDDFYELLTAEKVDEIVAALRASKPLPTPRPEASQWQWTVPS